MACRECCRQALHNTKLHNTGVRSLLSIDVLVQVIKANVRAGQVKADPREVQQALQWWALYPSKSFVFDGVP